jgi:hypothetical protein
MSDAGYLENPAWMPPTRTQALSVALSRLPASARAKYDGYVAAVEDAQALMESALRRARDLEDKFQVAVDRADRAVRAAAQGATAASAVTAARDAADAVRREYRALEIERDRRRAAHGQAAQTIARLDTFLLSGVPPCRAVAVQARAQDGETLQQALERVRAAIGVAQREAGRVRSAPLPAETIAAQIRDQVRQLAAQGMPHVTIGAGDTPPRIEWPDGPMIGALGAPSLGGSKLLAALFPKQLEALLLSGVDKIQGISPAERAERLAKLAADILGLEHEEEALVELALAKGLDVDRRGDVSGFGLLGIEPISPAELMAAE